jgi:hypothetical protein
MGTLRNDEGTVSEQTVEALYEQVCRLVPAAGEEVSETPVPVAPGIRVLAPPVTDAPAGRP